MALETIIDKIMDGTIPKEKTILNVCNTGQTASYATGILNLLGYNSQNLLYGMCAVSTDSTIIGTHLWNEQIITDEFAGQLVTKGATVSIQYQFPVLKTGKKTAEDIIMERARQVIPHRGEITADKVFAQPENYFIINYWPQAEYENPGHIPGAYCFPPKTSLKTDAMLSYLPNDRDIVIYCYTGQTSAQITAYLQILGYKAKNLLFGMNGFAYQVMTKTKYYPPFKDYSAIIEK